MRLVWVDESGDQYEVCTDRELGRWLKRSRHTWQRDLSFRILSRLGAARLHDTHDARNDPVGV